MTAVTLGFLLLGQALVLPAWESPPYPTADPGFVDSYSVVYQPDPEPVRVPLNPETEPQTTHKDRHFRGVPQWQQAEPKESPLIGTVDGVLANYALGLATAKALGEELIVCVDMPLDVCRAIHDRRPDSVVCQAMQEDGFKSSGVFRYRPDSQGVMRLYDPAARHEPPASRAVFYQSMPVWNSSPTEILWDCSGGTCRPLLK